MDGPRHPRHRALAATDALIVQAEQLRAAQIVVLAGLIAAGHSTRRVAILLQIAEERLDQLRASRDNLLGAEPAASARR